MINTQKRVEAVPMYAYLCVSVRVRIVRMPCRLASDVSSCEGRDERIAFRVSE